VKRFHAKIFLIPLLLTGLSGCEYTEFIEERPPEEKTSVEGATPSTSEGTTADEVQILKDKIKELEDKIKTLEGGGAPPPSGTEPPPPSGTGEPPPPSGGEVPVTLNVKIIPDRLKAHAPASITFSSQVTGGTPPYAYTWKFTNGKGVVIGTTNESTGQVTQTFRCPEWYKVELSVNGSAGGQGADAINVMIASSGTTPPDCPRP
jgi:hypothetical protein